MRTSVFLVLAVGIVACLADPTAKLDGVEDLDPSTFDKFVNGGKAALVEFYAPWCGHCKHLTPEYKKVGEAVKKDGKLSSRVVIAKVDADAHRSIGERFGVQGFPTIKFFPRGVPVDQPEDYQGPRKAEDFLSFIDSKLQADQGWARVPSLDSLAQQFRDAPDLSSVLSQLTEKVSALTEDAEKTAGDLYVKYGQKSVDKGYAWIQTEYDRLERMLTTGKVSSAKSGEISRKLSVLGAFLEDKASETADTVQSGAETVKETFEDAVQ